MKRSILTRHDDENRFQCTHWVCLDHRAAFSMSTQSLSHAMMAEPPPGLCRSSRGKKSTNVNQSFLAMLLKMAERHPTWLSPTFQSVPFTFILHWDPRPCPRLLSHWGSKLFRDKKDEDILDHWLVLISSLWLHQSAGLWTGISHIVLWESVCH